MSQAGEDFGLIAAAADAEQAAASNPQLQSAGSAILGTPPRPQSSGGVSRIVRTSDADGSSRLSRAQVERDVGFNTPKRASRAGSIAESGFAGDELRPALSGRMSSASKPGSHIGSRVASRTGSVVDLDVPTALGGINNASFRPRETEHIGYDPALDSPDASGIKPRETPQGTPTGTPHK
eukprot:gene13678-19566_t